MSSADWFNCENQPIDKTLPDDCLVLHVLAPMSLHKLLGAGNLLYDVLDQILVAMNAPITAENWAVSCSLNRLDHYGGKEQFNGHQIHTLLKNLDKLKTLLNEHNLFESCKPLFETFENLQMVVKSCFGKVLYPRYYDDIKRFAASYFKLMAYCRTLDISLNVTYKVHGIFVHIRQYLNYLKETFDLEIGLGFARFESSQILGFQFISY